MVMYPFLKLNVNDLLSPLRVCVVGKRTDCCLVLMMERFKSSPHSNISTHDSVYMLYHSVLFNIKLNLFQTLSTKDKQPKKGMVLYTCVCVCTCIN